MYILPQLVPINRGKKGHTIGITIMETMKQRITKGTPTFT